MSEHYGPANETTGWAMYSLHLDDLLHWWTISKTRKEVIEKVEKNYSQPWSQYRKHGYRIVKVKIIPAERKAGRKGEK